MPVYRPAPAGVGYGVMLSACTKLRDEQFIAAAEAVARMVTRDDLSRGAIFPPLRNIREVRRTLERWRSCCTAWATLGWSVV